MSNAALEKAVADAARIVEELQTSHHAKIAASIAAANARLARASTIGSVLHAMRNGVIRQQKRRSPRPSLKSETPRVIS